MDPSRFAKTAAPAEEHEIVSGAFRMPREEHEMVSGAFRMPRASIQVVSGLRGAHLGTLGAQRGSWEKPRGSQKTPLRRRGRFGAQKGASEALFGHF